MLPPCKPKTLPEIYNDKTVSCWLGMRHWEESGPSAQTHPSTSASLQWQGMQAVDWEGGREDLNVNVSFIRAPHPASTAVWKHNCNENPIDPSRFLSDKLHCFLRLSVFGRQMQRAKMKALGTSSSTFHHDRQTLHQFWLRIKPSAEQNTGTEHTLIRN